MDEFLRALPVYFSSMLKFAFGPLGGFVAKLHFLTTVFVSTAGMMTMVFLFTFFGDWINKNVFGRIRIFRRNKQNQTNPRLTAIWKKYGLMGVAFLTPLILTPIGGTLIAVSSGSPREKIIFYMFVSAAVWSLIFTGVVYFVGREFVPDIVQ